jgi:hypothetical protein
MRTIVLALGVLAAAAVINTQPAGAQQQGRPWCAEMPDYATECTFVSRQQCEADVTGLGGFSTKIRPTPTRPRGAPHASRGR